MLINKITKVVLVLLSICYIVLQGLAFEAHGNGMGALILILLTFLYCRVTRHKRKYFFYFILSFTVAQIVGYLSYFEPELKVEQIDYYYYSTNSLYILSYIFLIIQILGTLDLIKLFTEFTSSIVILFVLDVFCVIVVSATTENILSFYEYTLEFLYNAVIMTLLSVALLQYMYRNDNKSMLFLVGSIFVVFSEIIQLAYFYILDNSDLSFIYALFMVLGLTFFYLQSQVEFTGPVEAYTDETIEV